MIAIRHASGPPRLRQRLRAQTNSVRSYVRVYSPIAKVHTSMPAALFGGELLAMLSAELRAALPPTEDAGLEMVQHHHSLAFGAIATDAHRLGRQGALPQRRASDTVPGTPAAPTPSAAVRAMPSQRDAEAAAARWPTEAPYVSAREAQFEAGDGIPRSMRERLAHQAEAATMSAPLLRIHVLLDRILKSYAQTEQSDAPSRGALSPVPPTPTRADVAFADTASSGVRYDTVNWTPLSVDELEARMRAFGHKSEVHATVTSRLLAGQVEPTDVVAHLARTSLNDTDWMSRRPEFSDVLAAVLREQAQHHGIDVT